jgi:mannitol/fructose-specific phosphotransferase system IIA component (Ntr-type)
MNLLKYLKPSGVVLEIKASDKKGVIEVLLEAVAANGGLAPEKKAAVLEALLEREALTSTGLGYGLAVPHVKTNDVDRIQIVFGRSIKGIDFESLDGNPAHFFFLVLAPTHEIEAYLRVLSAISFLMKDEANRRAILRARSADDVIRVLDQNV